MCLVCGVDTGKIREFYFITTELWLKVMPSTDGMLCIGCLEVCLERRLTPKDFPQVTINSPKLNQMSDRLRNRIGH